jgi:hypothetical protein
MAPDGVIRPIADPLDWYEYSLNQRLPSGPTVSPLVE